MAKSSDSVSVIIPAYNAAAYISAAIDSALGQTHTPTEVIVVDDGSVDETPGILAAYGDRIVTIRQQNRGAAAACNTGAGAARGEWLAFLDADDLWLPMKLERQISVCGHTAFSHTDSVCFGPGLESEILRSSFEPPVHQDPLAAMLVRNYVTKSSVLVKRSLFLEVGGFPESHHGVEDWPLWISLCARAPVGYLPEPVVRYRVHPTSKSTQVDRTLRDHRRIIDEAFAPGGPGHHRQDLKRRALAASYNINGHFALEAGDLRMARICGLGALYHEPATLEHWKQLARVVIHSFRRIGRRADPADPKRDTEV